MDYRDEYHPARRGAPIGANTAGRTHNLAFESTVNIEE
jgi:hypothetical protein